MYLRIWEIFLKVIVTEWDKVLRFNESLSKFPTRITLKPIKISSSVEIILKNYMLIWFKRTEAATIGDKSKVPIKDSEELTLYLCSKILVWIYYFTFVVIIKSDVKLGAFEILENWQLS